MRLRSEQVREARREVSSGRIPECGNKLMGRSVGTRGEGDRSGLEGLMLSQGRGQQRKGVALRRKLWLGTIEAEFSAATE